MRDRTNINHDTRHNQGASRCIPILRKNDCGVSYVTTEDILKKIEKFPVLEGILPIQ